MSRVQSSIVIDRPVAEVFAFAADYRNDSRWRAGVQEVRYLSDEPVGVGIRQVETLAWMGRPVVTESMVSAYDPDREVAFESISGPYRVRGSRTFEAIDDRTRFTFALETEPVGFVQRLAMPALGLMYRRQVAGDLRRLKAAVEGRSASG